MRLHRVMAAFVCLLAAVPALAQVHGGGGRLNCTGCTTGTIPVVTGANALGNSPLTVSGGNVGLNTTTPDSSLSLGVGSAYRLSNTRTDASNGDWYEEKFTGNVAYIGTNKNGTGVSRSLILEEGGSPVLGHPNGGADTTSWASGPSALASQSANSLNNTASGASALRSNTTGNSNTASGINALFSNTTGGNNTASGASALRSNTTGNSNTASGASALRSNTTGGNNTTSGVSALFSNTTGSNNTASGASALFSNTTGNSNTASGVSALFDLGASVTAGSFVSGISYTILTIGTTDFTLIGAASNTVGLVFTATGVGSGTGTATPNTNNNTAVGYNTGRGITYGVNNTIIGANVTGLSPGLSSAIILAGGAGSIRADYGMTTASSWTFNGPVNTSGYTVATLPAAGTAGRRAYVTDQLTACPAFGGTFTGGGTVVCAAFDNGTAWISE